MALSGKVELFDRDITVLLDRTLGPAAQSAALAQYARVVEKQVETANENALGYDPDHKTIVDGSEGGSEDSVKPNGVIVYEFDLLDDLFIFIDQTLIENSPVKSGRYARSHKLYLDGVETDPASKITQFSEAVFANVEPYARKIEQGESPQFPDGVYESVAMLARQRFGNLAKISFAYRSISGGAIGAYAASASAIAHAARHSRRGNKAAEWLTRQPAIVITVK